MAAIQDSVLTFCPKMRCVPQSDMSAVDWRSQTQVEIIVISHVWRYGFSQWWESLQSNSV